MSVPNSESENEAQEPRKSGDFGQQGNTPGYINPNDYGANRINNNYTQQNYQANTASQPYANNPASNGAQGYPNSGYPTGLAPASNQPYQNGPGNGLAPVNTTPGYQNQGYAQNTGYNAPNNSGYASSPYGANPGYVNQPYGANPGYVNTPVNGMYAPPEPKSRIALLLLCLFLGGLGIHHFYIGQTKFGVVKLLMCLIGGGTAFFGVGLVILVPLEIWVLIDFILIIASAGYFKVDSNGVPIKW